MKALRYLAFTFLITFLFTACGDNVTLLTVNNVGVQSFESIKDFPNCVKDKQGEMAIAADKGLVYFCDDSEWKMLNGKDGEDGVDGKDGKNGADGKDGEKGADGKDGVDGKDGEKGLKGETGKTGKDGASCVLTDNGEGLVTVACGEESVNLSKAVCGLKSYDPAVQFCFEDDVYALCGGKRYDVRKVQCENNEIVFVDKRDNKKYKVTTIGKQTWFAENLNYEVADNSYCYDNEAENCSTKGRLYTWAAAMGKSEEECGYGKACNVNVFPHQGACPEGAHLPTYSEWNELYSYIIKDQNLEGQATGSNVIGQYLKNPESWTVEENFVGKNLYGFSALAAGYRDSEGFKKEGLSAIFWMATEQNGEKAYYYYLNYNSNHLGSVVGKKESDNLYSVRCLIDEE